MNLRKPRSWDIKLRKEETPEKYQETVNSGDLETEVHRSRQSYSGKASAFGTHGFDDTAAVMSHCVLVNSMERPSGTISFAISGVTLLPRCGLKQLHLAGSALAPSLQALLVGADIRLSSYRLLPSRSSLHSLGAKDEYSSVAARSSAKAVPTCWW